MERDEIARFFSNGLQTILAPAGYSFDASRLQFRKSSREGNVNITLSLAGSGVLVAELHLGARHNLTEELVGQITYNVSDFSPFSNTLSTNMARLMNYPFKRYTISDWVIAGSALNEMLDFLTDKGLPFLDSIVIPNQLEETLNKNPSEDCPYVFNQVYRCFRGLTLAYHCDKVKFHELFAVYRTRLKQLGSSTTLQQKFDTLYNHLRAVSLN